MIVKEYDTTYAVSAFIRHTQKRYISPGEMDCKQSNDAGDNLRIVSYEANGEFLGTFAVEAINKDYSEVMEPIGY